MECSGMKKCLEAVKSKKKEWLNELEATDDVLKERCKNIVKLANLREITM